MNNSFFLYIILTSGLFLLIIFLLYKVLRKKSSGIREYAETNGYKTKAEFIGYAQQYNYKSRYHLPVLKFKDNNGIEHIVRISGNKLLKYYKGDILNIDYIETEKIPDELKTHLKNSSEIIKIKLYDRLFEKPTDEIELTEQGRFYIRIMDRPTRISYYLTLPIFVIIVIIMIALLQ